MPEPFRGTRGSPGEFRGSRMDTTVTGQGSIPAVPMGHLGYTNFNPPLKQETKI